MCPRGPTRLNRHRGNPWAVHCLCATASGGRLSHRAWRMRAACKCNAQAVWWRARGQNGGRYAAPHNRFDGIVAVPATPAQRRPARKMLLSGHVARCAALRTAPAALSAHGPRAARARLTTPCAAPSGRRGVAGSVRSCSDARNTAPRRRARVHCSRSASAQNHAPPAAIR